MVEFRQAASILADYFGEDRRTVECAWRGRSNGRPLIAVRLHQDFKRDVISRIALEPGEVYNLEESSITT